MERRECLSSSALATKSTRGSNIMAIPLAAFVAASVAEAAPEVASQCFSIAAVRQVYFPLPGSAIWKRVPRRLTR